MIPGVNPGGEGHPARVPPIFGKNKNFHTFLAPPSAIGNNMIFWRKIVIFHTRYLNNFRASLRSAQFF